MLRHALMALTFAGAGMAAFQPAIAQDTEPEINTVAFEEAMSAYEARIAALESQFVANSVSAEDGAYCDPCCEPQRCCGWYVGYESVFLKPYFENNVAFVVANADSEDSLQGSSNVVQELAVSHDWDLEHSPRVWLGFSNADGLGVRTRYWQFHHTNSTSVTESAYDAAFGGDARLQWETEADIVDFSLSPSGSQNEVAVIAHEIELHVLDFEAMKTIDMCGSSITPSAGLRYLSMNQEATYTELGYEGKSSGSDEVGLLTHGFDGVGPTLGLEGAIGRGSLSFIGAVRGSVLFGSSTVRTGAFDPSEYDGMIQIYGDDNENDVLSIAELQLGVQYNHCLDCGAQIFLRTAFEAQYWWSGGSGSIGVDGDSYANAQDDDMGLVGFTVGAGLAR